MKELGGKFQLLLLGLGLNVLLEHCQVLLCSKHLQIIIGPSANLFLNFVVLSVFVLVLLLSLVLKVLILHYLCILLVLSVLLIFLIGGRVMSILLIVILPWLYF